MNLLDLPVELGASILSYLDTKSKINAYSALRQFYVPNVMKKFDVSRSSAASLRTLHLDVFRDLAAYIHELNLSGITDLTASQLSPHIQRCTNLKTLDITFTSIYLQDLDAICPENLKSISVNFFNWPRKTKKMDAWNKSIDLFQRKRFEYVHFIIFDFIFTDLPLLFMINVPKTKSLKITGTDNYINTDNFTGEIDEYIPVDGNIDVNFEKLNYVFRDCRLSTDPEFLRGIYNLDYNQIEYIFITNLSPDINIYVSPIFSTIFAINQNHSTLKIEVAKNLPLNFRVGKNIWFKAFHKSFTEFNDAFFKTLLSELTDFFPTYLCMYNKMKTKLTQAPSNWYCIDSCQGFERIQELLPEKVTLTDFCRQEGRAVCITTPTRPYLTPQPDTLKNITFLCLSGICLGGDFFTTLFEQCKNLHTLDSLIGVHDTLSLRNSMHLTKSLRNMRVAWPSIEHERLFASLCQCPTLENVHIWVYDRTDANNIVDAHMVLFIENSPRLYSLFIETVAPDTMSVEDVTSLQSAAREAARRLERDYLCINVCGSYPRGWNRFADVFNPSPLHILQ